MQTKVNADADLVLAMHGLVDQQRQDYGDADGFDAYVDTFNERIGSPSEATRRAYLSGESADVSDGPIHVLDSDGYRLDNTMRSAVSLGADGRDGRISIAGNGLNRYEGPLGSFTYSVKDFAVGYKDLGADAAKASVPVLYYIGNETDGSKIEIPKGLENMNYMFEGYKGLRSLPSIPDGVKSMHASFKDCTGVVGFSEAGLKDGASRIPDSVEVIDHAFVGCSKLEHGYDYVGAYARLRSMEGYGDGTQLPKTPERGINMEEMMVARELRGEDIPVVLDSSGVSRTMPHEQSFFESADPRNRTSVVQPEVSAYAAAVPVVDRDYIAVTPNRTLPTPTIPEGDYLRDYREVAPEPANRPEVVQRASSYMYPAADRAVEQRQAPSAQTRSFDRAAALARLSAMVNEGGSMDMDGLSQP